MTLLLVLQYTVPRHVVVLQINFKRVVIITAPLCTFIVICDFIAICSQKVCYEHANLCTRLSLWFLYRSPERQQQADLAKWMA